jgi:uncharacterized UPF0160 family protein
MQYSVKTIADKLGIQPDTIYKAMRRRQASARLAEQLSKVTGIDRMWFIYPSGYMDGWKYIGKEKSP